MRKLQKKNTPRTFLTFPLSADCFNEPLLDSEQFRTTTARARGRFCPICARESLNAREFFFPLPASSWPPYSLPSRGLLTVYPFRRPGLSQCTPAHLTAYVFPSLCSAVLVQVSEMKCLSREISWSLVKTMLSWDFVWSCSEYLWNLSKVCTHVNDLSKMRD